MNDFHDPTEKEIAEYIASWKETIGEDIDRETAIRHLEEDQVNANIAAEPDIHF